ncbi:MAG: DUF3467 domain-containing protein [Planctomycetales bacterium]|nr:DUF3467 domain-containing protein [Planctomycetales bacterium]
MSFHPDDRPDPAEQPIRARVPDRVASGAFSTGVIVMTAQTEIVLDFVQNLGRPHQIVARVVMPHHVLPQFADALHRNMDIYRSRWGELPAVVQPATSTAETASPPVADGLGANSQVVGNVPTPNSETAQPTPREDSTQGVGGTVSSSSPSTGLGQAKSDDVETPSQEASSIGNKQSAPSARHVPPANTARSASVQDIYDDLKIRDEFLSGSYANAVMIGHGPHEFSFDFITNFYPHSAVSARVFLAAGQIPRLYDSLIGTWEQLRQRWQPPPDAPPPQST